MQCPNRSYDQVCLLPPPNLPTPTASQTPLSLLFKVLFGHCFTTRSVQWWDTSGILLQARLWWWCRKMGNKAPGWWVNTSVFNFSLIPNCHNIWFVVFKHCSWCWDNETCKTRDVKYTTSTVLPENLTDTESIGGSQHRNTPLSPPSFNTSIYLSFFFRGNFIQQFKSESLLVKSMMIISTCCLLIRHLTGITQTKYGCGIAPGNFLPSPSKIPYTIPSSLPLFFLTCIM